MNILGTVRNGGDALRATLARIESLRQHLEGSRVIIATNDNTDDTDGVLARFAEEHSDVEILVLEGLADRYAERVDRITAARNALLKQVFASGPVYPLTLILDMDGPNTGLDPAQVLHAASRQSPHWDAVFGNPRPAYYDLYALRCAGWCETDVWQQIRAKKLPPILRSYWRKRRLQRMIYDRQYDVPIDAPLIEVDSAFGGLGLYKTDALKSVEYTSRDNAGRITCEHVMLHSAMRAKNKRLFIDPGLLITAPTEHLGPGSGQRIPQSLLG